MSQNPAFDSSIPVLTEVVLEPVVAPAKAGQAEAEAAIAVAEELAEAPAELAVPVEAAAPTALQPLPEPNWDELESRILERVVAQLQPQIDAVVRKALASAADQIHIGMRQAIEQVVAQQVASIQFGQKN